MFSWLFGKIKKLCDHPILDSAKFIIDNGELVHDGTACNWLPSVKFKDKNDNTLSIQWYRDTEKVHKAKINNMNVPSEYHYSIFCMAEKRIKILQKKHLEKTIKSVKR